MSIMFTDLEGSTELVTLLGDEEYQMLLRKHHAIVRQQVADHNGFEVKALGDGLMAVFSGARRAVACAIDIQRSIEDFNWHNPNRRLNLCIGLNVGEAIKEEPDFFGSAVVLAARLVAQATRGQILVSDLFRKVGGTTISFQYVGDGWKRLKGFAADEHIHEIEWRSGRSGNGGVAS